MNNSFRICLLIFLLLFCPSQLLPQDSTLINLRRTDNTPLKNHSLTDKEKLFPLKPINTGTGIWTELNPKVPRVTYAGIHFVNRDTGWAVGDLGALIKTTDGGSSWSVIETNTTLPILKVRSCNGQIVIASGYDGLILRSTDEGETFNQVPSGIGDGFDLWGLEMVNDTLGWACGGTALLKTTDSGENWQIVNTPGYTGNLWYVVFLDESYGFLAGDGKVLRTTDGGNNWEIIQAGDNQALYSIDIIDSLHIAAAGFGGTNFRGKNIYSSDGGFTWINGGTPLTYEPINDIKYVNRDTGYVIMNNIIGWKTTNRGVEWTPAVTGGEWEMQFLIEEDMGYSAGSGIRIYKTENSFENWQRLIINDNFADVFFVSEQKGFAISGILSPIQSLYKTTNGGINWGIVPGAPSGNDLIFLDSLTGFIGTDVIYKTTNGGVTWYVPNGGSGGAGKIFFINAMTGWAIRSNKIYKTTDKGENWFTQFTAPSSIGFKSIHFVDSLYGWTANLGGRPYKTTNGGDNWVQQTNLDIWESEDVFFKEYSNGFIINGIFQLLRTTNEGSNWFQQLYSQYVIRNFGWLSRSHGFIVGDGVYETADSGNTWNEILELRNVGLRKLQSPKNYIGYSIGNLGLIYGYIDTSIVPVELFSFEGKIRDNKIILEWQTASELNNKGFRIEKSFDKYNWIDIGFIKGNGTTTNINYYSYTDNEISSRVKFYRLKQIDYDGSYEYSKILEIDSHLTIASFRLFQNYPNPFNTATRITFILPVDSKVKLIVFDVLGREIKSFINKDMTKGSYSIDFDASSLNSGVYFYRLSVEGSNGKRYDTTKKMIVIK